MLKNFKIWLVLVLGFFILQSAEARAKNTMCLWMKEACVHITSQCQQRMGDINNKRPSKQKDRDRNAVCDFIFNEKKFPELRSGDMIRIARTACHDACVKKQSDKSVDPCAEGYKKCMDFAC